MTVKETKALTGCGVATAESDRGIWTWSQCTFQ